MNSGALQENFPEVYREFFSKCEIVVSAPRSFFWFGDNVTRYGEIGIRQKLPLRAYAGIELTNERKISFEDSQFFAPSDQRYQRLLRRAPRLKEIGELLESFCVKHHLPVGYRIHVLNELPVGTGLASWAPAAVAIAGSLLIKAKKLRPEDIDRWNTTPAIELANRAPTVFDELFRLAWKIETIYEGEASPGCGLFTSLVNSSAPIIFATEKRDRHLSLERLDELDRLQYWGARLHEFFGLKNYEHWPVDFGLIYTGSAISTEYAVRTGRDLKLALQDVAHAVKASVEHSIPETMRSKVVFAERTKRSGDRLWEAYLEALEATSLQGLVAFRQLFDRGYTDRAVTDLFHAINVVNGCLEIFNVSSPSIELTRHYLDRAAVREEMPLASKVTGAGRGGDVLFVTPLYALEHSMDSLINKLRLKVDRRIWLDHRTESQCRTDVIAHFGWRSLD